MKNAKHDLTQGSIQRHLLHLALPLILSNILHDLFNIVDMIFVGRLGSEALAAVALSGNLLRLVGVLAMGISTGTVIMISQSIGAKERARGEHIAMQALILSVVFSLGIGCLGYPLAEPGLRLLGADEEVVRLGVPYLRVMVLGLLFTRFLFMTLNSIFRGAGDTITPMIVLIVSSVLNIILDPLLIFGLWKFPRLGVVGSAYATLIGSAVGVVILLYLCFRGGGVISLRHVERRVNLSTMGALMNLGIFNAMQAVLRHASRLGFIRVVAIYGTDAVAAYAICMRLRILMMHPGFGFASAVSPMVGQNLGANRIDRAEKSVSIGNRLAIIVMGLLGLLCFCFPGWFIGWFTDQKAVIDIGSVYLRFLTATFGFMALAIVFGRALNGAGDTFSPMTITGIAQIGVGLILVLSLSQLMGMVGIWIGIALANVVQGIIMWYWFRQGKWKTKKLVYGK